MPSLEAIDLQVQGARSRTEKRRAKLASLDPESQLAKVERKRLLRDESQLARLEAWYARASASANPSGQLFKPPTFSGGEYVGEMPAGGAHPFVLPAMGGGLSSAKSALSGIPAPILIGGVAVAGAGVAAGAAYALSRNRSRGRGNQKRSSSSSSRKSNSRRSSSRKTTPTSRRNLSRNRRGGAVKARHGRKRVHLTKNGQPYVLMANGKARFIKR